MDFILCPEQSTVHAETAAEIAARTLSSQRGTHVSHHRPRYSKEEPQVRQQNEHEEKPLLPLVQND